ncbi:DUF4198 domain-containing protein [Xanthomonas hyacinthi]|uniref:DUF4198 domain-containing protein n=1 Tax=Xanthomonas hyacinthi TaxID=56455 RepID=A0A2S7ER53_9XANT|nr:DUF4198 domain-containing protein [Xanthomonas hyacinthi]KLD74396.1 ABC transporter permease [Xanthomonas hyacinthi DSM 19077]PPU95580.1 DUF4198 domain-containing protein [Xanthomonas hyacinthi]QGY75659.1 DUF4198 domain-containing protein [Xanthomonas hyacinthi]
MKRSLVLALAIAAVLPFSAFAHKAWLQPSQTVLAGEKPWITVDAAVSNDLFYFNHVPLRLDTLVITAPDGSAVQPQNPATGKYRSVFDVELVQTGTYRLALVNDGLFANWNENGQRKRWRGNAASFASEVPKDAKDLQVSQSLGRVETFVTNGAPNQTALKPSGRGLELVPVTHPNDLFAGEKATFKLHIDGKPAPGLDVEIVRGGTRYRNAQDELKLTTDAQGSFSVTWPEAGMYWLETTSEDAKTSLPQAKQRRLSYVATLEVLPQ